jgi:hypothetical protein
VLAVRQQRPLSGGRQLDSFAGGGHRKPRPLLAARRRLAAEPIGDSNASLPTFEPVSMRPRTPPGKGFARPETGRALTGDTGRFQAAETALSCVSSRKAAESQRLFGRRQETGIAQDYVVGLVGLKPATNRLWA